MLKNGDSVFILIGPHKGRIASVLTVEFNAGAKNGWVTVDLGGSTLLYAGEELRKVGP